MSAKKIYLVFLVILFINVLLTAQTFQSAIPSIRATSLDTVARVPIVISYDLPGSPLNIISYTVSISWDSTFLANPQISNDSTLTEIWGKDTFFLNVKTGGNVVFGHFATNPISVDSGGLHSAVLTNIFFDLLGNPGDSSRIIIDFLTINAIEANTTDGTLQINRSPIANELILSPTIATTVTDLNASYTYFDEDNDPEANTQLYWYKNEIHPGGNPQDSVDNLFTLPFSATQKGETWYFGVRPDDGFEFGELIISSPITILNSAPVADSLNINPSEPNTTHKLTAEYSFSDLNNDLEKDSELSWYKNDSLQIEYNNQSVIPEFITAKNQEWYFTLLPNDGEEYGIKIISPTVIIGNTPPTVDSLKILPANPTELDSLFITYFYNDLDHDPEQNSEIHWYKNNEIQPEFDQMSFIPASATLKDEKWHFTIKPGDGVDFGENKQAPEVVIRNLSVWADFMADTTKGIDSLLVQFTQLGQGPISSWYWDFGDGTTSTEQNPRHIYLATQKHYTVSLTVTSPNDSNSIVKPDFITVYQKVSARFSASTTFGKPGLDVQFTNLTTGDADSFLWDFGNGIRLSGTPQLIDEKFFTHQFKNPGNFTVTLIATGDGGCDSIAYPDLILIDENATELVLIDSGVTKPGFGWSKAIDQDVFTDTGMVKANSKCSWAIFTFADKIERDVVQFRLKPLPYHYDIDSLTQILQNVTQSFEFYISATGPDSADFTRIATVEIGQNAWETHNFLTDSTTHLSHAKYMLFKLLNNSSSSGFPPELCELAEIQVLGIPHSTNLVTPDNADETNGRDLDFASTINKFGLTANYPNPFNPETVIEFDLKEEAWVTLAIYNIQGQKIKQLLDQKILSGNHQIVWQGDNTVGKNVGSGTYLCQLRLLTANGEKFTFIQKMTLVR